MDVALASCLRLPEPDPDAEPLAGALAAAGIEARVLAWDDPNADRSRASMTVLRSTWNYAADRDGFLAWAGRVAAVSSLWNPLAIVRWNSHKRYLFDLERRGIPIVPTVLVERGAATTLDEILSHRDWSEVVIKPAVSAASFRTLRVGPSERDRGRRHLREILVDRDALVQRYLPSVESHGERALVWIDGEATHAVRKSPRFAGDDESVSDAVPISGGEAELARRVFATIDAPLLYGRLDVAPGPDGLPVVMELELIEPSLFFRQSPRALTRFVGAIRRRLPR